eukprot:CAMPEP_0181340362 /NCGR_PEP_ID=MMETSP1101-20121128/29796_1 /TAXON_ID=46948 /ORGANISM="Rhodomonas abbreviata, Strain Caron Lab Isolate" /LENGTH=1200 /DNA_ID=CAMNT_0023451487 /DNA_START=105 /DNA_END=3707 /DNA_ORIENTATION=+
MHVFRHCPVMVLAVAFAVLSCVDKCEGLERARRSFGKGGPQESPEEGFLSDGTEDPDWSLRLEARPGYDLVNGAPHHWQFTNRGKPLRILIMRGRFPETGRDDIPVEGNLNQSMEDTRLYYLDQSWGKIEYEYFYAPIVDMATPAASTGASSIREESLAATAALGYVWCGGPCGTNLADEKYQDPSQASDLNSSHFDMAIVAFRADNTHGPFFYWAGLANLGSPWVWTKYPTSSALMEHEIGHNFGISHGRTAKDRDGTPINSRDVEGFSRMAAGGAVSAEDQTSRYNENGHFGAAYKHWNGWLEDSDVVFLHPEGNTFADCALCQSQWTGKLNAMDRPDVVPGAENTPYFAAKIPIGTTGEEVLYVYFRTSYAATRKGVSIQYCRRGFGGDAGMSGLCYTFDAHGASYTMDDSVILPGTTYVAFPPHPLVERIGWTEAMKVIPVIHVTSVPDLDTDPDCANLICNVDKEIAAQLSIRFLSDEEKKTTTAPSISSGNTLLLSPGNPRSLSHSDKALIVAEDHAKGVGGYGELNLTVCPSTTAREATVYFYDNFPLAATHFSSPLSYGAIESHTVSYLDCCTPGDLLPTSGVRVVVVRQNDPKYLNIAEIEIYAAANDAVNIAPSAVCYQGPVGGWYYSGEADGLDLALNDEDYSTVTHSGYPEKGGGQDYAVCVLPQQTVLAKIKLVPHNVAARSKNWTLALYAEVLHEVEDGTGDPPLPIGRGLMWQTLVEHETGLWQSGEEYPIPSLPTTFKCDNRVAGSLRYTAAQGKAYALIDVTGAGASDVSAAVDFHTCPGVQPGDNFDFSYPTTEPGNTQSCHPCPERALDLTGMAPCSSERTCDIVHVPGPKGGLFQAMGLEGGRKRYKGKGAAKMAWNGQEERWELTATDGTVIGTKTSNDFEEGWTSTGMVAASPPYTGVRAVVLTQNQEKIHNICELEIFDFEGNNIAPEATCWNLPGPLDGGDGYWYTGGDFGEGGRLNDGDSTTCEATGDGTIMGRKYACIFAEVKAVAKVRISPPDTQNRVRASNLNLTFFEHIPDDSPPTIATLSGVFSLELEAQDMSPGKEYELCRLPFETMNPWATSNTVAQCEETRDWEQLMIAEEAGDLIMREGGMGKLMQVYKFEVWACFYNTSCVAAVGPSNPPQQDQLELAGPDGVWGTADDEDWADWACYVFDEQTEEFLPWGFNSELRLFDTTTLP